MYVWESGDLKLRLDNKWYDATLEEAAADLPRQALVCLASRRATGVHFPNNRGSIVMTTDSDSGADWCESEMRGYYVRSTIKWSVDQDGGSLFFEPKYNL
jgi:hypothetical protein